MKPIREWTKQTWVYIGSGVATFLMFAQVTNAMKDVEYLAPATHGWVRDFALARRAERDLQIAGITEELKQSILNLDGRLDRVEDGMYKGQLSALRGELVELQIRLRDNPGDTLLLRRQAEVLGQIEELLREEREH